MGLIEVLVETPNEVWINPVVGIISSLAGYRENPVVGGLEFHDGVDIVLPIDTAIIAPRYGYVIATGYSQSFGRFLRLSHGYYETFYAHLNSIPLAIGDRVGQGDRIAYSGNTGWSTAPHLHFGLFKNGEFIDPKIYFCFTNEYGY